MELNEEQLKEAETLLKKYLPQALPVYGVLMLMNRAPPFPMTVFVDRWPEFNVVICRPQCKERGDLLKYIFIFANDETILKETIRNSPAIDWSRYLYLAFHHSFTDVFKAVAVEKGVPHQLSALCNMMVLKDISKLPDVDSSGISLGSLNESHASLVNQTWKFAKSGDSLSMIRNMVTNSLSCCVLDAEGKPVAWILLYHHCAMGMLFTLPEHRGKGYAKVLICSMAKRLHTEGYPVCCFIEEENTPSYRLFTKMGFTEEPAYKGAWFEFNEL